jgi:hypothetical protein
MRITLHPSYYLKVFRNLYLFSIYRFPHWHVFATEINRDYKNVVKQDLGTLYVDFVGDIGCGLGDIIGNLPNKNLKLIGFDIDSKVLKAAKKLHQHVDFYLINSSDFNFCFEMVENNKEYRSAGAFTLLNWINTEVLESFLEQAQKYPWRNVSQLFIYFDIRSISGEEKSEYQYIPTRKFLDQPNAIELLTKDSERNVCRVLIDIHSAKNI